MKWTRVEFIVGLFMLAGILCLSYLAVALGGLSPADDDHYILRARFVSASGLKTGADVEIAGVVVGRVASIHFDPDDFEADVELTIPQNVRLQEDAIASIRSTGIIGGKFVKITPGGSEKLLAAGEEILETESSISLEELLSKYIFGSSENAAGQTDEEL